MNWLSIFLSLFTIIIFTFSFISSATLTSSPSDVPSSWPMFHANTKRTGQSSFVGPSSCRILWKYTTGYIIFSSPTIGSDGTIYFGSSDYNVYALNGKTGDLIWNFKTDEIIESSPAIGSDGAVYVGSYDYNVYALNGTNW